MKGHGFARTLASQRRVHYVSNPFRAVRALPPFLPRNSAPLRSPHRAHFTAAAAAAEEAIASIGLESRDACASRHFEPLQHLAGFGINPPHIALFAIHPGDAGDEAVGLDRAEDRPGLRVDLMNFSRPILADPERAFGPGEAGVTAAAGGRDRGEHAAGPGVDLLDAIFGNLKQMLAVKRRSGTGCDIDLTHRLSARGVERVQLVARRKPDVLSVIGDAIHALDARKGTVLSDNFGGRSFHLSLLATLFIVGPP